MPGRRPTSRSAERYGVPVRAGRPLRPEHVIPSPPDLALRAASRRASWGARSPSTRRPTTGTLVAAAAASLRGAQPTRCWWAPVRMRSSTCFAKAFLPPGGAGCRAGPDVRDVSRPHRAARGARPIVVPRLHGGGGVRRGPALPRVPAAREGRRSSGSQARTTPPGCRSRKAPSHALAGGPPPRMLRGTGAGRPWSSSTKRTRSSPGDCSWGLRTAYPRLVVVRTASKAYALAGMRVGFAIADPELLAEVEPYRPPGSVAVPSVAVVTAALRDPDLLAANVARVARERSRLADGLARIGLPPRPSVTNFLLVDLRDPDQARTLAEGPARPRARSAHVRLRPPPRGPPPLHRPRRDPGRPAAGRSCRDGTCRRCGPALARHPRPGDPHMTTPLGNIRG